jgi:hypothetical protein
MQQADVVWMEGGCLLSGHFDGMLLFHHVMKPTHMCWWLMTRDGTAV